MREITEKCMQSTRQQLNSTTAGQEEAEAKFNRTTNSIIDETTRNLTQKIDAIVNKYMSVPKYATIPGWEDLDNAPEQLDELECQTEKRSQELEAVCLGQKFMIDALTTELRENKEVLSNVYEVDESLCKLIKNHVQNAEML